MLIEAYLVLKVSITGQIGQPIFNLYINGSYVVNTLIGSISTIEIISKHYIKHLY